MYRAAWVVLAGCLVLAGCTPQLGDLTSFVNTRSLQETPRKPRPVSARPAPKTSPKPQIEKPAVPEPVTFDPGDLINKSRDEIGELLGKPEFIRKDPPVEFWRYQDSNCVLEVFFYRRKGVPLLDHFEMRGLGSNQTSDSRCLNGLIRGKTAANMSRKPYPSPLRRPPRG